MKFLVDQDVYAITIVFLSGLGHDAVRAAQVGLAQVEDAELLRVAHEQERIFVTRDRDFGALVFVQGGGPGVIFLRILPPTQNAVHAQLERVLTLYCETELRSSFVVIEPGRHRIRKLAPRPRTIGRADPSAEADRRPPGQFRPVKAIGEAGGSHRLSLRLSLVIGHFHPSPRNAWT